jgi:cytochrome P450
MVTGLNVTTGPIVRITPDELHIQDTSFYQTLYSEMKPRDKYFWMRGRFGAPDALAVTLSHSLHAERRAALAPLFSTNSIQNLEPMIWASADELCKKMMQYARSEEVLPLQKAWASYAGDVVMEAMLGENYGHVKSDAFSGALDEALKAAGETGPLMLQFPFVMTMVNALSDNIATTLEPRIGKLLALQKVSNLASMRSGCEKEFILICNYRA